MEEANPTKILSAKCLSNLFTNYYRKKYALENNGVGNPNLFAVVPEDMKITPFEKTIHSTVSMGEIKLTKCQRSNGNSKDDKILICIKDYGEGRVKDATGRIYSDNLSRIEGKALEILTPSVSCLPVLYGYEERQNNIRLIMEYIPGCIFGKSYREFDKEDLVVLEEVAVKQPVLQSELENKKYGTIDELVRANFVHRVKNSSEKSNKFETCTLFVTQRFFDRFKIENKKLIEKEDYPKHKIEIFKKGIDSIFEFQNIAKKIYSKVRGEPPIDMLEYNAKIMHKLKTIVAYKIDPDGKIEDKNNGFYGKENLLKTLFSEGYLKEITKPLYEHTLFNKDIIQGDCHPLNMMVDNDKVRILDLSHISFGPWISDFVDYITYLNLFCNLSDEEAKSFYYSILGERMRINPGSNDEKEFHDIKARMDLERSIVATGSLSGLLLNFGKNLNTYEKAELHKRRKKYLHHIYTLLDTKSENGSALFGNTKLFLEQLLF